MKDHESAFPVLDATRAYESGTPCADYACSDPGMTKYEYAAIHLKVPRSGDPDIDDMIRESRRAEFAKATLDGLFVDGASYIDQGSADRIAEQAFRVADALLAEWEWEKEAGK